MTPRFMLDTDSVSYALRGVGRVAENIKQHSPSEIYISVITVAELRYGAELRQARRLQALIDVFCNSVEALPFDENAAARFGILAAMLSKKGLPIGAFDVLIAAHALARDLTLVTNNQKHFRRIPGLRIANWV